MPGEFDLFFLKNDEPVRNLFIPLRKQINSFDKNITEAWKFNMPFFCYEGERVCYLRVDKKTGRPYIGFVEGKRINNPLLAFEERARIKVFWLNPEEDLPVESLDSILKAALAINRIPPDN